MLLRLFRLQQRSQFEIFASVTVASLGPGTITLHKDAGTASAPARNSIPGLVRMKYFLILLALGLQAAPRQAIVTMSDGTIIKGKVQTRNDAKFRIVTQAGEFTQNLGRTENVASRYGKQFDLGLDLFKRVEFMVRPDRPQVQTQLPSERMERQWKWKERNNTEKVYIGEPFPIRNLEIRCFMNSGEEINGTLQTIPLYVQEEGAFTAKKFFLKSKQKGKPGQSLPELLYIRSIDFLDKGKEFFADLEVTFRNIELGPDTEVRAIGNNALTPLPVVRGGAPNSVIISRAHGDLPLVGVRNGHKCTVAWPGRGPDELFAITKKHMDGQRDYFNNKQLLGVYPVPDSDEVHALVVLRRHKPDNSKETEEFFRFSVWRWKYNPKIKEMILMSRGTFFRIGLPIGSPAPETTFDPDLWHIEQDGDKITIGKPK